ncbi:MAG TPA: plastocyanin/azurin family copper-binding protein [Actinomycetota bacterium]
MSRAFRTVLVVLALGLAGSSMPAQANDLVYASGPGSGVPPGVTYTPPIIVIQEGDSLTYVNLDVAQHDVRSRVKGPDQAWCTQFPFNFASGKCPLFTTKLIGAAGQSPTFGIESVPALGTEASYEFYCTIHAWMVGDLFVV